MKIEHVAFNVPDAVKAARWYVEHLGMQIVRSSNESPYIHFIADSAGQTVLELYSNPAVPTPDYATMHPFSLHIAFVVDDIEAVKARLVTAGATLDGETTTTPAGDQLAFVRDPWGVTLQLAKRVTPLLG
jgi:catechol 2,3-dioxygenase-like lactoylglutathione lyase family enzyme